MAAIALGYRGPNIEVHNHQQQVRQYILNFPEGANADQHFGLDEAVLRTAPVVQAFNHLHASGLAFRILIKIVVVVGDPEGNQGEWYD